MRTWRVTALASSSGRLDDETGEVSIRPTAQCAATLIGHLEHEVHFIVDLQEARIQS